jgi:hypothetical protein
MTDVGSATPAFFGFGGATIGLVLANLGAAMGMAKAGVSIINERNRVFVQV